MSLANTLFDPSVRGLEGIIATPNDDCNGVCYFLEVKPPARIKLKISGPLENREIEITLLPTQVFTVGRRDCNLNINDARISRRHLSLSVETGVLVADDLGSHNGTLFNSEKGTTKSLNVGDTIEVGDHRLELLSFSSGDASMERLHKDLGKEDQSNRFLFFPEDGIQWPAIQRTLVLAFKEWQTFWQDRVYLISLDHSLVVLSVLAVGNGLVAGVGSRNMSSIGLIIFTTMCTLAISLLYAALLSTLRGFLELKARFPEFVAFTVYLAFFNLPLLMVSKILGGLLSFPMALLLWAWIFRGFYLTFSPHKQKFIIFLFLCALLSMGIFGSTFLFMTRVLNGLANS